MSGPVQAQGPRDPKRRPLLRAVPPAIDRTTDPAGRLIAAEASAAALLAAGHAPGADVDQLVALGDEVGLDALAMLWARAESGSLPGALWAVYALRAWCRARPTEVSRLASAGRPHAEVAASVAGLPAVVGPDDVRALGDDVVRAVVARELPTALHRAAALARVLAAGWGATGDDAVPEEPAQAQAEWAQAVLGARLLTTADSLDRAALRVAGPDSQGRRAVGGTAG